MKMKIEVNKKGRKWIQVTVIDEKFTKKAQLLLDENTKPFNVGDIVEGDFDLEKTFNRYFKSYDWTLTYITEDTVSKREEAKKQADENKAKERLIRLANQWVGYIANNMKEKGKWYQRGEDTAKSYGEELKEKGYMDEYEKILNQIEELREKYFKLEKEAAEEKAKYVIYLHNFEGRYIKGTIIEQNGKLYKITKTNGFYEPDSMSFGGWGDNLYMYTAEADSRLVTEAEKEEYYKKEEEYQKRLKELEEEQRPERERKAAIEKLRNYIKENGQMNFENISLWELQNNCVMLKNDFNIYGGGEKVFISDNRVWLIINNGMDGDMWDLNNIKTHGAGAYGYYKEIDEKIRELISMIEKEIEN